MANPNLISEAEPGDSSSIAIPSEEEQSEEQLLIGLYQKQHYAQYVQAAAKLGEDMPLGEDTAKVQTDKVCITMPSSLASNFFIMAMSFLVNFPIVDLDQHLVPQFQVIEYLCGAAHLREVALQMTGVGLCHLHLALAGSPAYEVFEVLQQHFLSEVQ